MKEVELITEVVKDINKHKAIVYKLCPEYKYFDKVQYLIYAKSYLNLSKIMEIVKEIDDECGYIVFNQNIGELQECFYRMEGKGLLFTEIENKEEWI